MALIISVMLPIFIDSNSSSTEWYNLSVSIWSDEMVCAGTPNLAKVALSDR